MSNSGGTIFDFQFAQQQKNKTNKMNIKRIIIQGTTSINPEVS
jgi:hypothetical protein